MESFQSPRNRRVVLRSTLALLSLQPAIGSALPGRCAGNRRPFTGKKRRSACTDSLVDAAFLFTLKAVHHLPAQNIHFVRSADLVPEVFDLNQIGRASCREREYIPVASVIQSTKNG